MADINRAWGVLSDPSRRRQYDLSIADARPTLQGSGPDRGRPAPVRPIAPARVPWRGMLILASVGIALVLVLDATSTPPEPGRPDQLLQGGSCVRIDERNEVYEVSCADIHDGVVRQLVAMDRPCPVGTDPHRDRQGMGRACIVRIVSTGTTGPGVERAGDSG